MCSHVKITWQWKSTLTLIKCVNSMRRLFFDSTKGTGSRSHIPFPFLGIDSLDHILNACKKVFNIEQIISMLKELLLPSYPLNPVIIFVLISLGRSKDYGRDHSPNACYIMFLTVSIMNSEERWSILTRQPLRHWSPKDFPNLHFIASRLALLCFVSCAIFCVMVNCGLRRLDITIKELAKNANAQSKR